MLCKLKHREVRSRKKKFYYCPFLFLFNVSIEILNIGTDSLIADDFK